MQNLLTAKTGKALIVFIAACLLLLAISGAAWADDPVAKQFSDMPAGHWAFSYVTRLTNQGAITGMPDGTFAPGRNITRAELVTLVVGALLGRPEAPPANQHWAVNIMQAARENDLLEADEFAPDTWDTPINRQEMAKIMVRAMQYIKKEKLLADTDAFTAKITDFAASSENYKSYIAQAYAKGIVAGYPDGSFGGGKQATRAEASTMVVRLLDPYYRLSQAQPVSLPARPYDWTEIIGTVNGENVYRFEYDYYLNAYYNEYFSNYYEDMLLYDGVDLLDEESSREFLSDMENFAWTTTIQAVLIRQMAFKEYNISLDSSYYETLLLPDTALSINTNRLYTMIYPFIEQEATTTQVVGEAEAKEYYLTDPTAWDCRKVAHIIITAQQMLREAADDGKELSNEEAQKAAQERAKEIIARLAKGEDFAKLAEQYSGDSSAQVGGVLDLYFNIYGNGVSEEASLDQFFAEGAFLLKDIGDYSKEPVESYYGYHVIKLLDKKEGFDAIKTYMLSSRQTVDDNAVSEYFSNKLQNLEESAVIERKFAFKYYKE